MAKKALLLGINNYKSVSDLRGCIRDVETFRALLTNQFGFGSDDIHSFTDEEVVKNRIESEWKWLIKNAQEGDTLVFMFAGHGSQTDDKNGDEDDGVDELLCLYDMDFDDPDTYLLDDDIGRMTKRVPEGVSLTMIFDCCHSGTATRLLARPGARSLAPSKQPFVDEEASLQRAQEMLPARARSLGAAPDLKQIISPRTPEEERRVVLVRYIEPPLHIRERMHRNGVRKGFRKSRSSDEDMNHVLFSGCKSDQTSADAWIESEYRGAFSFYFCQQVKKLDKDVDQGVLIKAVRDELAGGSFSQVPQLEPKTTQGPLFGLPRKSGGGPKKRPTDEPSSKDQPSPALLAGDSQQVVTLLKQILDELKQSRTSDRVVIGPRSLVSVHGICHHPAGYSNSWWQALKPHLPAPLAAELEGRRPEVLWSDLVNAPRAIDRDAFPADALRAFDAKQLDVTAELQDVLADRARQLLESELPAPRGDFAEPSEVVLDRGSLRGAELNCIDDFTRYLLSNMVRREVQKRFLDVVLPLLEAGGRVDVMSHSWGTVVAYEALRTIDNRDLRGKVANLFTIGSALSIGSVQRRLETDDGARPTHVLRWINLDARRDIVGGPLRAMGYRVDEEFLNLDPIGCRILDGFTCPHSSYFAAANIAVNRDIFAARLDAHE
jgi:hypothetical protein